MKVELERVVVSQGMQENWILAIMPQIWKFGPRPPENDFFRKFLIFMERSLNFAPNEPQPPQTLSLCQVMQENLILDYYAQIWKFDPGPQKMIFFRKFLIFMERSPNFTSNELSSTPRH